MRALKAVLALALLAAAAPAAALAAPVDLRQDIASEGDKVTLGDLFYDAGDAASVIVARPTPGQPIVLDASRVQVLAHQQGLDWRNPAGLRRIIVDPGSAPPARSNASTREEGARRAVQVLAYLHPINAGDMVRASDLTWSRSADAPIDAPRDADAVIGMVARRPLREGAGVSLHDVAAPQVIKKDDIVSVAFGVDGITLTLEAKAMADATAGQALAVMNTSSKKILQAVATGPGQAVVGPEAEQLKLAARASSSSRLALR